MSKTTDEAKQAIVEKAAAEKAAAEKNTDIAPVKNEAKDNLDAMFDTLEGMDDKDLVATDADYLIFELGKRYDVCLTGDYKLIPNKMHPDYVKGGDNSGIEKVSAVCGLRRVGGVMRPFINMDIMLVQKVQELVSLDKVSREKPYFCRIIVDTAMTGDKGKQFKKLTFLAVNS